MISCLIVVSFCSTSDAVVKLMASCSVTGVFVEATVVLLFDRISGMTVVVISSCVIVVSFCSISDAVVKLVTSGSVTGVFGAATVLLLFDRISVTVSGMSVVISCVVVVLFCSISDAVVKLVTSG